MYLVATKWQWIIFCILYPGEIMNFEPNLMLINSLMRTKAWIDFYSSAFDCLPHLHWYSFSTLIFNVNSCKAYSILYRTCITLSVYLLLLLLLIICMIIIFFTLKHISTGTLKAKPRILLFFFFHLKFPLFY